MRGTNYVALPFLLAATVGCGTGVKGESTEAGAAPPAIGVTSAAAVERPIRRFLEVTGTFAAQEEAEVAAEVQGRVVATPVERGTRVADGDALIRIAAAEMEAQAAEADANAAQIVGRLGLADGSEFSVDRVPEVANARANLDLAEGDFTRAQMLFDRKLLSKADFDQRTAQAEVARRQYDIARNGALQQYQALLAARARVSLAKKALADTVVRSPFAGVVGQRLVSVGDYVARGTKVASVMRTNPLRVNLTVPAQYSADVAVGRPVSLEVDAAPGQRFEGQVRYVSPALQTDSRTLVVEALVANDTGILKPGAFATARIEQATERPAVLVPKGAVRTLSGTSRVYVVTGDRVEERIVTIGQAVDDLVEISTGLKAAENVATSNVEQLIDGARIARK
jgi:membrane fusion protein (multidrug efflux system)